MTVNTLSKFDRVTYNKYAGIRAIGSIPVSIKAFKTNFHLQRAAYLATSLESPSWGSIQSYDGAGISAGPFHWIAVYPSTLKQGPLFGIISKIRDSLGVIYADKNGSPHPEKNVNWKGLSSAFSKIGWYLSPDGVLRDSLGKPIPGDVIRNTFAPVNGLVPQSGQDRASAETWAILFHNLFSDSETYASQITCATQYLVEGQQKLELSTYQTLSKIKVMDSSILDDSHLKIDVDLAMCVYHAHSVNAPGIAAECLLFCQSKLISPNFSKILIQELMRKKYGNWDKRYVRTRLAAQSSGLWPSEMFVGSDAIMPKV